MFEITQQHNYFLDMFVGFTDTLYICVADFIVDEWLKNFI